MQVRYHIDSRPIEYRWYRGKEASISKEEIICLLDQQRPYDLAQAYEKGPHVDLMNLSCDQDWVAFVNRWGPLWMSGIERSQGRSRTRLEWCWAFQRCLKSYARLLECFGRPGLEGHRLRDFLNASEDENRVRGRKPPATATVHFFVALQLDPAAQHNFDEEFKLWLRHASQPDVRRVIADVIKFVSFAATGCLVAEWQGVRPRIAARLTLDSLDEALEWMVWNGYWMKKPQMFCQECQRAFRPESAHPRKYCSYDCAHRATDRAWHKRKRAMEKKGE